MNKRGLAQVCARLTEIKTLFARRLNDFIVLVQLPHIGSYDLLIEYQLVKHVHTRLLNSYKCLHYVLGGLCDRYNRSDHVTLFIETANEHAECTQLINQLEIMYDEKTRRILSQNHTPPAA